MTDVLKIPDAWIYEVAQSMRLVDDKLEYTDFWPQLTVYPPNAPQGSVRNICPLYAAPPSSESLLAEIEQLRAERDAWRKTNEQAPQEAARTNDVGYQGR